MRILVVEDDPRMSGLICEVLTDACYAVDPAEDGETADELMDVNAYDLVLLDWGIPAPSGIELLRKWRDEGRTMPILMLTARDTRDDKVGGLDTGADDYLTKPFSFVELLARVRSLLRRREVPLQLALEAGDLRLDRNRHQVTVAGAPVVLSPKEYNLLILLASEPGRVFSSDEIIAHLWPGSSRAAASDVKQYIHLLRSKLDKTAHLSDPIENVKGFGYRLIG